MFLCCLTAVYCWQPLGSAPVCNEERGGKCSHGQKAQREAVELVADRSPVYLYIYICSCPCSSTETLFQMLLQLCANKHTERYQTPERPVDFCAFCRDPCQFALCGESSFHCSIVVVHAGTTAAVCLDWQQLSDWEDPLFFSLLSFSVVLGGTHLICIVLQIYKPPLMHMVLSSAKEA